MAHNVKGPADFAPRKQSRPSRTSGRAGLRRLEALLEAANIVIQRVDTENDIGRDAFIEIVQGTDVTGGVICVQVKSGRSFFHDGRWVVPGKPSDFRLWRESTIPVFGVVHDPDTDSLRWADLSHAAALALDDYLSPVVSGPYGKAAIPMPDDNRLDLELTPFLDAAETALRRRRGSHAAALLSSEIAVVNTGIADTFAVGRHDPVAFLLLAALLQRLPLETRRFAIVTLALTTSHPDVWWTKDNWIPREVGEDLRQRISWTEPDVVELLAEVDERGMQRGTIGQSIYHVLDLDRDLDRKLLTVALDRALLDEVRFWAAATLLYRSREEAPAALDRLLSGDAALNEEGLFPLFRRIEEVAQFDELISMVTEFGYIDLFG